MNAATGEQLLVQRVDLQRQPAVVVKATVPVDGIAEFMGTAFARVAEALARAGVEPAGAPFGRYEMSGGEFLVEAGFPVHARPTTGEGVEYVELPGGPTARTVHVGSYDTLGTAYQALEGWVVDNGYQARDLPWETYLDEPDVPAPRTAVYLPCEPVSVPAR